jgi:hypothetical protein
VYEGYWKDGKMDGGGEFRNGFGFSLKGLFKNNLFNHENKMFLNPFNPEKFNSNFVDNFSKYRVKCDKNAKIDAERVRLYRVSNA